MYVGDRRHFGARLLTAGQGRVTSKKAREGERRVPSYAGLKLRDVDRTQSGDAQGEMELAGNPGPGEVPF